MYTSLADFLFKWLTASAVFSVMLLVSCGTAYHFDQKSQDAGAQAVDDPRSCAQFILHVAWLGCSTKNDLLALASECVYLEDRGCEPDWACWADQYQCINNQLETGDSGLCSRGC